MLWDQKDWLWELSCGIVRQTLRNGGRRVEGFLNGRIGTRGLICATHVIADLRTSAGFGRHKHCDEFAFQAPITLCSGP